MATRDSFSDATPDQLFTATVALAWSIHAQAVERQVPNVDIALVLAIGELERGPWRQVDNGPLVPALPMTLGCSLLDRMLDELERLSRGFGARVAIARARDWLDPRPDARPFGSAACCFCPSPAIDEEER